MAFTYQTLGTVITRCQSLLAGENLPHWAQGILPLVVTRIGMLSPQQRRSFKLSKRAAGPLRLLFYLVDGPGSYNRSVNQAPNKAYITLMGLIPYGGVQASPPCVRPALKTQFIDGLQWPKAADLL